MEDQSLAILQTLPELFATATLQESSQSTSNCASPVDEDITEAERLKTEGNEQMKLENFESAISFYTKAIDLNSRNAVYFCNRLALSSLNKHSEAVDFYKRALELDPDNDTYKANLKIAEQKMKEMPSPVGAPGGLDLAGLLNNPGFMNMASNLMNNPQVQQLMSGMISGSGNPMAGASAAGNTPPTDLASLIQAGQQFAQQMQQQNPELIEQLRSQIRSRTPSASNEDQHQ